MQPQSDKQSASKSKLATATARATRAIPSQQQQPPKVKVIKSKRPLCHFKFYLDICDHQLTRRIEAEIKALGGTLEFFLNDSITHFITDKDKSWTPEASNTNTSATTGTTAIIQEDGTAGIQRRSRQTRADAILSRVRAAQQQQQQQTEQLQHQNNNNINNNRKESCKLSYTIWKTEYALRFFQRIQTELRQYLVQGGALTTAAASGQAAQYPSNIIQLRGNFIKIESIRRNHRPYYHLLKQPEEWPKIDLSSSRSSEESAFRLQTTTRAAQVQSSMTRKSLGSRTSQRQQDKVATTAAAAQPLQLQALKKQTGAAPADEASPRSHKESSEKQCGVCEICKIEYDTLTLHLQSKEHELFAKNSHNFYALDSLIQVSASVEGFLEKQQQQEKEREVTTEDSDMDVDELLSSSVISCLNQTKSNDANLSSSSNNNRQRPTPPALREKSKRITKGKHYSEKFRATTPNSQTTPASQPDLTPPTPTTTTTPAPATSTTRRKTQNSVLSPPMRAMLPPSSLYKVVDTNDPLTTTTPRIRRGLANNTTVLDSPSLIVKFQKVRQSELQRLNGEAENFMFPRTTTTTTRSSSELATDVDRQTTSDVRGRTSISSASLDSATTSEAEVPLKLQVAAEGKRATAVGRRRKGQISTGSTSNNSGQQQQQQQRFPNAPIQPEIQPQPEQQQQLLMKQQQQQQRRQSTTATATRKSSRMATAIVTAATTSSQLQLRRRRRGGGGNLEDRMGEAVTQAKNKVEQQLAIATATRTSDEDEEEDSLDEQEEEESSSSGSDEDYVANGKLLKKCSLPTLPSREERAARRLSRLTINLKRCPAPKQEKEQPQQQKLKSSPMRRCSKAKTKQAKQQPATTTAATTKATTKGAAATTVSTDLIFDCSKSERLQKLRYAFEELPGADLWHRVFQRQDTGDEHYYSYYGTTRYRKLPYELGPIPMERTSAHSCTMCRSKEQAGDETMIKLEKTITSAAASSSSSLYKHKKLHLLQRYQQEQQQQQQQQQGLNTAIIPSPIAKCDSKASTPELLEREFEHAQLLELASTQSNSSSTCSNRSQKSGLNCRRHKQLARISELPPRKSPREHASTLALVSCIIRQRQDSQSKTNSEAEEPTTTVIPSKLTKREPETEPEPLPTVAKTRSQAATPVEELRFATEISETVKRMRRGQNKYDSVQGGPALIQQPAPPPPSRCRRPTAGSYSRRLELAAAGRRENASKTATGQHLLSKRSKRRQLTVAGLQQQAAGLGLVAGVRKLPSKKGLLEYEMEASALKSLDASAHYVNPLLVAWQIDKYLELAGREFDPSAECSMEVDAAAPQTPPPTDGCFSSEFDLCDLLGGSAASGDDDDRNSRINLYCSYQRKRKCLKSNRTGWPRTQRRRAAARLLPRKVAKEQQQVKEEDEDEEGEEGKEETVRQPGLKQESLEIEEELALTTTTPTTTNTTTTTDKEMGKDLDEDREGEGDADGDDAGDADGEADGNASGGDVATEDKEKSRKNRENAVMTPPATDVDDEVASQVDNEADEDNPDEDDADEDDDETMADSVDQQLDGEVEIEATDADVEEDDDDDDDNDDDDDDVYEDAFGDEHIKPDPLSIEPTEKRARRISYDDEEEEEDEEEESPVKKTAEDKKTSLLTSNGYHHHHQPHQLHHHRLSATSTPSTQQTARQQQQRGTPQLNGSLGSCISPSEKLGDNSDIFTVSSDGLDTDLDLSNTQAGDALDHCTHQQQQQRTPKRKFDISKYAPPNNGKKAASSCAAEAAAAATAAVKSLAISQFLKKETCASLSNMRNAWRPTRRTTISAVCISGTRSARALN
ncbi:GH25033 [Drosophila grimshawi]|uniref:GH25033 n=1 Tax=Drosophila grimshawi TaxID=7222 RepID=B4JZ60_DROGR|nr:GH25033 [Drosophila grimshawi]